MVSHTYKPITQEAEAGKSTEISGKSELLYSEFQTILGYIVSSRQDWANQWISNPSLWATKTSLKNNNQPTNQTNTSDNKTYFTPAQQTHAYVDPP